MAARSRRIEVGQTVNPFTIERIEAEPMKTVAAVLRDPAPFHFDREAVRQMDMGDRLINQGPLTAASLMEMVVQFAGGPEAIRKFDVRFTGNVCEGNRLECSGSVIDVDDDAGIARLDIEATVEGNPVLTGTAEISI